jgi:mannose-6-phosphate isomerase-like protein (cupin superfamily)
LIYSADSKRSSGCDLRFPPGERQNESIMKISNVFAHETGFDVLETTKLSQTAVMILGAGESSGQRPSTHKNSDQVLIVLEGEVLAETPHHAATMRAGDSVIIPAGTPHKFTNRSQARVVTFSVYAPPEYETKG